MAITPVTPAAAPPPATAPAPAAPAAPPPADTFVRTSAPAHPGLFSGGSRAETYSATPGGKVSYEAVAQFGSPVLRRMTFDNWVQPKPGVDLFEKWTDQLQNNPSHSEIVKYILRDIAQAERCPQGIMLERVTLTNADGQQFAHKMHAGECVFLRVNGPDGADYAQRGDPGNRMSDSDS